LPLLFGYGPLAHGAADGAVNSVFLDWSVRRVGLKELWTLNWNRTYDVNGAWTRRGGVQPDDWPQWMRGLKDY